METQHSSQEQLTCLVSGTQTWHVATAWQKMHIY